MKDAPHLNVENPPSPEANVAKALDYFSVNKDSLGATLLFNGYSDYYRGKGNGDFRLTIKGFFEVFLGLIVSLTQHLPYLSQLNKDIKEAVQRIQSEPIAIGAQVLQNKGVQNFLKENPQLVEVAIDNFAPEELKGVGKVVAEVLANNCQEVAEILVIVEEDIKLVVPVALNFIENKENVKIYLKENEDNIAKYLTTFTHSSLRQFFTSLINEGETSKNEYVQKFLKNLGNQKDIFLSKLDASKPLDENINILIRDPATFALLKENVDLKSIAAAFNLTKDASNILKPLITLDNAAETVPQGEDITVLDKKIIAPDTIGAFFDTYRLEPEIIKIIINLIHENPLELAILYSNVLDNQPMTTLRDFLSLIETNSTLKNYIISNPERIEDIIEGFVRNTPNLSELFTFDEKIDTGLFKIIPVLLKESTIAQDILNKSLNENLTDKIEAVKNIFELIADTPELQIYLQSNAETLDKLLDAIIENDPSLQKMKNQYLKDTKISSLVLAVIDEPQKIKELGSSIVSAFKNYNEGNYLDLALNIKDIYSSTPAAVYEVINKHANNMVWGREQDFVDFVGTVITNMRHKKHKNLAKYIKNHRETLNDNIEYKNYLLKHSLENTTYKDFDMSDINFKDFNLSNCTFNKVDFNNSKFDNINFNTSIFSGCEFTNVTLRNCSFEKSQFYNLSFKNTIMDGPTFKNLIEAARVQGIRLNISGIQLQGKLEDFDLTNVVNLHQADFSKLDNFKDSQQTLAHYIISNIISSELFGETDTNRLNDTKLIYNLLKENLSNKTLNIIFEKEALLFQKKFILTEFGQKFIQDLKLTIEAKSTYTALGLATGGIYLEEAKMKEVAPLLKDLSRIKTPTLIINQSHDTDIKAPEIPAPLTKEQLAQLIGEQVGQKIFGASDELNIQNVVNHLKKVLLDPNQNVDIPSDFNIENAKLLATTCLEKVYYDKTKRGWNTYLYMPEEVLSDISFSNEVGYKMSDYFDSYKNNLVQRSNEIQRT